MSVIVLSVLNLVLALFYLSDAKNVASKGTSLNLNQTFFSSLENYQVNATAVTEAKYPWIAKVIHSRVNAGPYICTASCLKKRIFLTAARCIHSLKVQHTTVLYQKTNRLSVLAFVLPSKGTKQAYDDLGFIVTTDTKFNNWKVVDLYGWKNRTDYAFEWFKAAKLSTGFLAVGYATTKGLHKIKSPDIQYNLTELNVVIGMDLCENILNFFHNELDGFKVPCYHSCSVAQFKKQNQLCVKYHGVEGGAIIEAKTNKLVGISTWGPNDKYELPAGLSVANSANFFEDYECANAIAESKVKITTETNLQKLCK